MLTRLAVILTDATKWKLAPVVQVNEARYLQVERQFFERFPLKRVLGVTGVLNCPRTRAPEGLHFGGVYLNRVIFKKICLYTMKEFPLEWGFQIRVLMMRSFSLPQKLPRNPINPTSKNSKIRLRARPPAEPQKQMLQTKKLRSKS